MSDAQERRRVLDRAIALHRSGRPEEAVTLLGNAIADDPEYPPFTAVLALALADAGHPKAALATMLGCALDAARPGAFDGYERALTEYHQLLLEKSQS